MKKKNLLSLLLALAIVFSSLAPIFAKEAITDMPTGWSKEYMEAAVKNKIFIGNQGKVRPRDNMNRAEFITVFSRILSLDEKADISQYKDVEKGQWYYDDIARAVKAGIIEGRSETMMKPTGPIKREEAFTVIARVLMLSESEDHTKAFVDGDKISDWAKPSINALAKGNYIEGNDYKQLKPRHDITREEMAALLYRLIDLYVDEDLVGKEVKGNLVVNGPIIKIKDTSIGGDLIIAEGANVDKIVLDNVKLSGRLVVRSKANLDFINKTEVNYALALVPTIVSLDETSKLKEAGKNIDLKKEDEVIKEEVSKEVVGEGERFDLDTGFKKAVWVEIEEDGKLVGQGGMTEADGIAKINLTKEGKYKLLVKEKKDGKLLKEISLTMLPKKLVELEKAVKDLEEVLAKIAKVDRTKYTEESFANLSAKYSEGMALIEKAKTDEKPSLEDLKKAGEAFEKALVDLKKLTEEEVENKKELEEKKGALSVLISKANEKISILGSEDSNNNLLVKAEADVLEALKIAHNSNKVSEVEDSMVKITTLIIELDKAIGK